MKKRVLFIAGREPGYMRNVMILKSLRECDVEVIECTSSATSYLRRHLDVFLKFMSKKNADFDFIFVGYMGHILVPILRRLSDKPIIFDVFLSIFDTLCYDRCIYSPDSLIGRIAYWLDKYSCALSDIIILDTDAHIDYFKNKFGLEDKNFKKIYVGADESIFYPLSLSVDNDKFRIFYYCSYHPLHGMEYIVRAAKKLEIYEDIEFEIIGNGMEFEKIISLADTLKIKNIRFIDWIQSEKFYNTVRAHIATSDICLGGHFSDVDKGKRVIAEKTFEFISMKKSVIVGDNPANRELFRDRENAMLVDHANPDSIASAILELKNNRSLRDKISAGAYETYKEKCTTQAIGLKLKTILTSVIT